MRILLHFQLKQRADFISLQHKHLHYVCQLTQQSNGFLFTTENKDSESTYAKNEMVIILFSKSYLFIYSNCSLVCHIQKFLLCKT